MSAQQFGKSLGYEKWHRRLGHTLNREIQETVKHVIGLEELSQTTYEKHRKCVEKVLLKIIPEKRSGPTVHLNKSILIHFLLQLYQSKDISMLW